MDDPFAPAAPASVFIPANNTNSKEISMTDTQNNNKITATLKGGSGFDAPWIVIHGNTPAEVLAILEDTDTKSLLEQTQKVGQFFAGLGKSVPAPAGGRGGGAPAGAQSAPAGAPESPGEGWVFKSGVSAKSGKPWKAWMPPQGSDAKPLFFN